MCRAQRSPSTVAGDREAARYQVLRALELAPSYPQALELLLELRAANNITQWIPDRGPTT